jgi:hypothetical protein
MVVLALKNNHIVRIDLDNPADLDGVEAGAVGWIKY